MKFILTLSISIFLHIGIYFLLVDFNNPIEKINSTNLKDENQTNTQIQYIKLKAKDKIVKEPLKNIQKPTKTNNKKIQSKKIAQVNKEKVTFRERVNKPNKVKEKEVKSQKIIPNNKEILTPEEREYQKLSKEIEPQTQRYLELYEDFENMPTNMKIFILKNINDIGAITQRYLFYPHMSAQAGQEGINVVEFMLFENGHISKPKIIKSSGYFLLDDNTEETIRSAYIDYPRPSKPTPIRIYVKYILRE